MKRYLMLLLLLSGSGIVQAAGPVFEGAAYGSGSTDYVICNLTGSGSLNPGYGYACYIWIPTTNSVVSVSDGGTSVYYGSSGVANTFPGYANATHFQTVLLYTCNYAGNGGNITASLSSASSWYTVAASFSGQLQTGNKCAFAYNKNQNTSGASGTETSQTVSNNAGDLLFGWFANNTGAGVYSAGTDGQGNSYTQQEQSTEVVMVESLSESTATTPYAGASYTTTVYWNAEILDITAVAPVPSGCKSCKLRKLDELSFSGDVNQTVP